MPLVTVEIPNPTLPSGWVFKVEYAQMIFGMPPVWTAIADQTNAPFNLILSAGGWALKISLDTGGAECDPVYYCFRVNPPCVGCPTLIDAKIAVTGGLKYLHVDMLFGSGWPYCGIEINAKITPTMIPPFNQTVTVTSQSMLTPVVISGTTYYRKTFLLNGILGNLTKTYLVTVRSLCCSYSTTCGTDTVTG